MLFDTEFKATLPKDCVGAEGNGHGEGVMRLAMMQPQNLNLPAADLQQEIAQDNTLSAQVEKCRAFCCGLELKPLETQQSLLWKLLIQLQGCRFYTAKGLEFSFTIKGGEMFVSRKSKSITQATVFMAYRKGRELMKRDGFVAGPKKLGTFGASYLYPVFVGIGLLSGGA